MSIFAIFDGHNGTDCVKFVSENLINKIRCHLLNADSSLDSQEYMYAFLKKCLVNSIQEVDLQFFSKYSNYSFDCGCTAVIVVIVGDRVICANVGDSRPILSRSGKPVCLSKDFKPENPEEKRRIEEAGGYVLGKRLNAQLATSRTFGNFRFKIISRSDIMEKANGGGQDMVTVHPEIREIQLNW